MSRKSVERCQRSEIEVTPEMIEAGAERVAELAADFPPAYVAEETFLAMAAAQTS
jgi:hypothetical protein